MGPRAGLHRCGKSRPHRDSMPGPSTPNLYRLIYPAHTCNLLFIIIFCGSAAQRGLWPPVALQSSAGYGLLWLCSPARAMASCGSAAQRGLWPPRSRGCLISSSHRPLPDKTQHKQQTNIHASGGIRTHERSRRAAVDLRLRPCGHWDRLLHVITRVLITKCFVSLKFCARKWINVPYCSIRPRYVRDFWNTKMTRVFKAVVMDERF
jgi:hypothetical protein